MRLNDATPADWDRLRQIAPASRERQARSTWATMAEDEAWKM